MNKIITIFVLCLSFLCCKAQKVEPFKKTDKLVLTHISTSDKCIRVGRNKTTKKVGESFFSNERIWTNEPHSYIRVFNTRTKRSYTYPLTGVVSRPESKSVFEIYCKLNMTGTKGGNAMKDVLSKTWLLIDTLRITSSLPLDKKHGYTICFPNDDNERILENDSETPEFFFTRSMFNQTSSEKVRVIIRYYEPGKSTLITTDMYIILK